MGVWGQRPQQANGLCWRRGSELASDPCRRDGQKLVSSYNIIAILMYMKNHL